MLVLQIYCNSILTFLNWSRLHTTLPMHLTSAGCCALFRIVGIKRCKSIGSKYQFTWPIISPVSLIPLLIRWTSSQAANTMLTAYSPQNIDSMSTIEFTWSCNWNGEGNEQSIQILMAIELFPFCRFRATCLIPYICPNIPSYLPYA